MSIQLKGSACFDDVYGSIAAYHMDNKQFYRSDGVKYGKTSWRSNQINKPVRVMMGTPLKLVLAEQLPSYANLKE